MRIATISLFCLFFLSLRMSAQVEAFDPTGAQVSLPKLIRISCEYIEMPHVEFTRLMKESRSSPNDSKLREACEGLVDEGKAGVLETVMITMSPGQSSSIGSTQEYIYPTEYEPAISPSYAPKDGAVVDKEDYGGPSGTAFDTKELGVSLSVEAQYQLNELAIEMSLNPRLVYLSDTISWGDWNSETVKSSIKMPLFYTMQFRTELILIDGQTHMAAAMSPMNEKGIPDTTRKVLAFVRAEILTVGK